MRSLVRNIGICLIGFAAAAHFVDLKAGVCAGLTLAGLSLVIDSLSK